jgi:hypothetical protein
MSLRHVQAMFNCLCCVLSDTLLCCVCCLVDLQCRVEGNPQNRMQFRVTVAAPDPALASSVKDMIVAQVMAVP